MKAGRDGIGRGFGPKTTNSAGTTNAWTAAQLFMGTLRIRSYALRLRAMLLPRTSVTNGGMSKSYEVRMKKQPLNNKNLLGAIPAFVLAFSLAAAEPPAMPQRAIAPDSAPLTGRKISLREGDTAFILFVPDSWKPSAQTLTVHFHTAEWFVIQEHVRRGAAHPLATFYLGEGSTVYRRAFEDRKRFGRVLELIASELGNASDGIEISSFSAGYGAVREIIKHHDYFKRVRAIILADSMYAGLETNSVRQPLREHIEVWLPFARAAIKGEKVFVFTYSAVPTAAYASSSE